jgi:ubiquinone/menaquinone biosynthesis C-methylase UbiE
MNYGHRGIRNWGLRHVVIDSVAKILDIGCGAGKTVYRFAKLSPNCKVYGVDYSEDMVELSKKINKRMIKKGLVNIQYGNVSRLPFEDDFFDLVTAFESYYFWPNLAERLKGDKNGC